jgi:TonB family protein
VRRYLPYVAFSIAFHGCLLLAFSFWKIAREPLPESRKVILEFHSRALRQSPSAGQRSDPLAQDFSRVRGLRVADAGALPLPAAAPRIAGEAHAKASASAEAPSSIERTEKPRLSQPGDSLVFPSAAETLKKALTEAGGAPLPSTPQATAAAGGYKQETALEWKDRQRQMLRSPELRFPELLAEEGLEVDVEAAFAVAPNGQVTRVEIMRSSGFASVDRAVVQALHNTLFDASPGDREDQGRISFHFRLERNP